MRFFLYHYLMKYYFCNIQKLKVFRYIKEKWQYQKSSFGLLLNLQKVFYGTFTFMGIIIPFSFFFDLVNIFLHLVYWFCWTQNHEMIWFGYLIKPSKTVSQLDINLPAMLLYVFPISIEAHCPIYNSYNISSYY